MHMIVITIYMIDVNAFCSSILSNVVKDFGLISSFKYGS
jgi:hypothetical protein